MLDSFKNWNILKLSHKATPSEGNDKIHQFVLDGISDNMYALVKTDKYGTSNKTYKTTMGYYVIKIM